jgi:hypothetical protein
VQGVGGEFFIVTITVKQRYVVDRGKITRDLPFATRWRGVQRADPASAKERQPGRIIGRIPKFCLGVTDIGIR